MTKGGGGPERLGDLLSGVLRDSGIEEKVTEASVVPEWPELVGPRIAGVTQPLRVSRGTLIVAVRSSAWLMELKLEEREILKRINEGRSTGCISRIRFLMADSGSGPWK